MLIYRRHCSYLSRIKDVAATRAELPALIQALSTLYVKWSTAAANGALPYADSVTQTEPRISTLFTNNLAKLVEKISKIAERDQRRLRPENPSILTSALQCLTIATSGLHRIYQGPGQGRYNNDHQAIKDISIEPTHEELVSEKVRQSAAIPAEVNQLILFSPIPRTIYRSTSRMVLIICRRTVWNASWTYNSDCSERK
jgi:hypothetical protein